jgi:hypothetical protein
VSALTAAWANRFNAQRRVFLGVDADLFLLKADKSISIELAAAWSLDKPDAEGVQTINIARNDDEFNSALRESSFIVILDSTNPSLNNQLCEITYRTACPGHDRPYWIVGVMQVGKRYVP